MTFGHCSLLEEPRKPSNSRILEPLRVSRALSRAFPVPGMIGSVARLSDAPESVEEVSGFPETTTLVGIQRLKRLRRVISFLETVIFASQVNE